MFFSATFCYIPHDHGRLGLLPIAVKLPKVLPSPCFPASVAKHDAAQPAATLDPGISDVEGTCSLALKFLHCERLPRGDEITNALLARPYLKFPGQPLLSADKN